MGKVPVCRINQNDKSFELATVSGTDNGVTRTITINKWSSDKPLTYALINDAQTIPLHINNRIAMNEAIRNWSTRIPLKVKEVKPTDNPDCPIQFSKTDPQFLNPDGTTNFTILGYGWQGDVEDQGKRGIMLNGWINWGLANIDFAYYVVNVLCHEFGHILGLGHSASQLDIMYAIYNGSRTLGLGDIRAIQALYGIRTLPQRIYDVLARLINTNAEFK